MPLELYVHKFETYNLKEYKLRLESKFLFSVVNLFMYCFMFCLKFLLLETKGKKLKYNFFFLNESPTGLLLRILIKIIPFSCPGHRYLGDFHLFYRSLLYGE